MLFLALVSGFTRRVKLETRAENRMLLQASVLRLLAETFRMLTCFTRPTPALRAGQKVVRCIIASIL